MTPRTNSWRHAFDTPRAHRLRRRWGWPAAAAGACLLAAAWLQGVTLPAQRAELAAARADAARALQRAEAQRRLAAGAPATSAAPAARFVAQFPPVAERHVRLAALVELAKVHGVDTPRVESRAQPGPPLGRDELTLSTQGDYERTRAFIADALDSDPALSLDALQLRRSGTASDRLDGELRWSLYQRPDGAPGLAR